MINNIAIPEWFPMRVTYNRELKIKDFLDSQGIENFIPMHYEITGEGDSRQMTLMPAIHNLIFIRLPQEELTGLKMTRRELEPLRYMMRPTEVGSDAMEIIRVPDRQMENFMRVASVEDDSVMFLRCSQFLEKAGQRVRVTNGFFAGVEGVIKRIKNNRRVVVQIDGVAAVAIAHVPTEYLVPVE